jgi:hypothetical protein
VVVSEERGTISFCFNGNIVSNLDGASLRQALLGLFGQRARAKKKPGVPRSKSGQAQTGSYRITLPVVPVPDDSVPPPSAAATSQATGSLVVTPLQPPTKQLTTQPMQPATPIETPAASAASAASQPEGPPTREPEQ